MVTSPYSRAASASSLTEYASGGNAYWNARTMNATAPASLTAIEYRPASLGPLTP